MKMFVRSLLSTLLCAAFSQAAPTITFPINSQVPPVARVSALFSFTFSASTFFSTQPITYSLSNAPVWLSLDGSSRTLSGTPPSTAANTAPIIEIIAKDDTGSVTMSTTLVVSGSPAPTIRIPLEKQLPGFGAYSAPSSILMYPSTPFTIKFDPETFSTSDLNYYAVTLTNTPLPSWIHFDGPTLSFTGTTPASESLLQPPQPFALQLIASEVLGFSGVAIPFNIVVANHELAFEDSFLATNTSVGKQISTPAFRDTLRLDGAPIADSNISAIVTQKPSWLDFDNSTFVLSGTAPETAASVNVTITVADVFGDTAAAIVFVNVTNTNHTIFISTLESLNATIGSPFTYDLRSAFSNPSDVSASVTESPAAPWLSLNAQTLVLSGTVPSSLSEGEIRVSIKASSKSTKATDTQTFSLSLISAEQSPTAASTTAAPTATSTNSEVARATGHGGLSKGQLLAAILVPILVVLAALAICVFCCWRRRNRRSKTPDKGDISSPVLIVEPHLESEHKHPAMRSNNDFADANMDAGYMNAGRRVSALMRRSHTMSTMMSDPLKSHPQQMDYVQHRSYSENAISNGDDSWRSTLGSSHPTSESMAASSGRLTRNFSRKTGVSQISRAPSTEFPFKESSASMKRNSGNVSYGKYRVSKSSIQQTPDFFYEHEGAMKRSPSSRKSKKFHESKASLSKRAGGLGHGSSLSKASVSSLSSGRYSRGLGIGYGQAYGVHPDHESGPIPDLNRSNSWLTVHTNHGKGVRPQSQMSALTESTDVLYPTDPQAQTIKMVPKSPATVSSRLSNASRNTQTRGYSMARPISRRDPRASPFFGCSSRSTSRGTTQRSPGSVRHTREKSATPAVPDAEITNYNLERSIMAGLRDVPESPAVEPNPLGNTYGNARDATGQLKTFVKSMTNRMSWNRSSPTRQPYDENENANRNENDSRFASPEDSPETANNNNNNDNISNETTILRPLAHSNSQNLKPQPRPASLALSDEDFYDRSSLASLRDSSGNLIQYELDESPELGQAVTRPSLSKPFSSYSGGSRTNSPALMTVQEGRGTPMPSIVKAKENFRPGPKRPVSVEDGLGIRGLEGGMVMKKQKSFVADRFEGSGVATGSGKGSLKSAVSGDDGFAFL